MAFLEYMNFKKYVDSGDDVTGGAFIDVKKLNARRKSTARTLEPNEDDARKSRYVFSSNFQFKNY